MATMNDKKWNELKQAEDMAYFGMDLCCYSLEEKKEICNDMISSSKAVLDATREDFQAYPPEFRSKLLAMICEAEPEKTDWWWDILVGDGDPLHRELETIWAIQNVYARGQAMLGPVLCLEHLPEYCQLRVYQSCLTRVL